MLSFDRLAAVASAAHTERELAPSHPAQALAALGDVAGLRELAEAGGWGELDPSPLLVAARHRQAAAVDLLLDFSTESELLSVASLFVRRALPHSRETLARIYAKLHGHLLEGESSEECKPTRKREREPDSSVCPRGGARTSAAVTTQRSTKTYSLHGNWERMPGRLPGRVAVEVRVNVFADDSGSSKFDCCGDCACRVLFELRRVGTQEVISSDHPRKTLEQAGIAVTSSESWKKFAPLSIEK